MALTYMYSEAGEGATTFGAKQHHLLGINQADYHCINKCRSQFFNDILRLHTATRTWHQVAAGPANGRAVAKRAHHTATLIGRRIWVVGGSDATEVSASLEASSMYAFSMVTCTMACQHECHRLRHHASSAGVKHVSLSSAAAWKLEANMTAPSAAHTEWEATTALHAQLPTHAC